MNNKIINLEQRVLALVDERADEIIGFLGELVQIPSLTGQEGAAQRYMQQALTDLDCELDIWEPDIEQLKEQAEFQQVPDDYTGRPNVVGVLRGTGGGRSLLLNGHIDVVPVEPLDSWAHGGPWSGAIVDGRLYGRGSSDMKGGLTAFFQALKTLQILDIRLQGNVVFESVVDEERGGNGTLAAVLRGYQADGAIIGEPTNMTITTHNAGALWVRITVPGKAAHGAYKTYGVNAIEKAFYLYQALSEYEQERQVRLMRPQFAHYDIPFPLNIGVFKAGDWPSSVPDVAVMEGRVGFSPEEAHRKFRREFEEAVMNAAQQDPWLATNPPEVEWFGLFMDSASIDPSHPLVETAAAALGEVISRPAELLGKAGGTDMRLLVNAGTPTLQIGPGLSAEAHTVNESVPVNNVIGVTKAVALILLRWCGVGAGR